MRPFVIIIALAMTCACGGCRTSAEPQAEVPVEDPVEVRRSDSLVFYFPRYSSVDHVCGTMPEPDDSSVIFCCSATFTGECLRTFRHSNIGGDHVSGGVLYKGYRARSNTGCFAYYPNDGTWVFAMGDYYGCIKDAEARNGCAFGQAMVIHNGNVVVNKAKRDPVRQETRNQFRVLAEYDGALCIIDAGCVMPYGTFIGKLQAAGVTNALYLDMGYGWNYSFYRNGDGTVTYIHDVRIPYTTNWLVFRK